MVYAKYNYGISIGYTHRQTEGHLLLTIHYLVRGASNTSRTCHVEILIERALLLVGVCARLDAAGQQCPASCSRSLQRHQRVMMRV